MAKTAAERAREACRNWARDGALIHGEVARAIEAAVAEERERIACALDYQGDIAPCSEDGSVFKSAAQLVRADFSYEKADRIEAAMVDKAVAEERARCAAKAREIGSHVHDSHTDQTVYDHGWRAAARDIVRAIERGDAT
jgi:hypothetical protein